MNAQFDGMNNFGNFNNQMPMNQRRGAGPMRNNRGFGNRSQGPYGKLVVLRYFF